MKDMSYFCLLSVVRRPETRGEEERPEAHGMAERRFRLETVCPVEKREQVLRIRPVGDRIPDVKQENRVRMLAAQIGEKSGRERLPVQDEDVVVTRLLEARKYLPVMPLGMRQNRFPAEPRGGVHQRRIERAIGKEIDLCPAPFQLAQDFLIISEEARGRQQYARAVQVDGRQFMRTGFGVRLRVCL